MGLFPLIYGAWGESDVAFKIESMNVYASLFVWRKIYLENIKIYVVPSSCEMKHKLSIESKSYYIIANNDDLESLNEIFTGE